MGFLSKFTGKKQEEKKAKKEPDVLDMVKEPVAEKSDKPGTDKLVPGKPRVSKTDTGRAHRVLNLHHLSEKTNALASTGVYVFKIAKATNKIEVKKAIERVYDVNVASVNTVNVKGKNRRTGRIKGKTSDWKKAYVTLKSGQKIVGLSEGV